MAAASLDLALPLEPTGLRAHTRAQADQDPAGAGALLAQGEWIAGPLWQVWGRALEQAGIGRERLVQIAVDYRRELWLWVMGERTWTQCASGLRGRVLRRLPAARA